MYQKGTYGKKLSFRLVSRQTVFKYSARFVAKSAIDPISKKKELIQDAINIERDAKILIQSKDDKGIALSR